MNLERTTPPAVLPIDLEEVKRQVVVSFTDDDNLLTGLINAAVARLDGYSGILGRCLINQVWEFKELRWDCVDTLPFPDVSSVTIKYADSAGAEQTLNAAQYQVVNDRGRWSIRFLSTFEQPELHSLNLLPITITVTAGYGAAAGDVPADIKHALLLMVAHLYENREATSSEEMFEVPLTVDALLTPHKVGFLI